VVNSTTGYTNRARTQLDQAWEDTFELPKKSAGAWLIQPTVCPLQIQHSNSQAMLDPISLAKPTGTFTSAPSVSKAEIALRDIDNILHPPCKIGINGDHCQFEGDNVLHHRLIMMQMLLWTYVDPSNMLNWTQASLSTAHAFKKKDHTAKVLHSWAQSFILDHNCLPYNHYGSQNKSLLEKGKLATEIHNHLLGVGTQVTPTDAAQFINLPEVMAKYGLTKSISSSTAKRWMHLMDYRWTKKPSGQYVDTKNYLTYFGPKHQYKHLEKHFRYFARYFSSQYLR
jgi:hypothetical protein